MSTLVQSCPGGNVIINQATYTVVHGSYYDHSVTNIADVPVECGYPCAKHNPPRQAGCGEHCEALYYEPGHTYVNSGATIRRRSCEDDQHFVPFPGASRADYSEKLCPPPRLSKRKRTAGGSPQPGEEPPRPHPPFPRDMHIDHLQQTIHLHQPPISNTPAWDRLLQHVVAAAAHDSEDRRDAPKCHPRTRKAAREEVISWIGRRGRDTKEEKVLWISGPAGTGKTAIAGSVADRCDEMGLLAGAFFFSATSETPDRKSKNGLITSLAYQLAIHDTIVGLKDEVIAAIDADPTIFEKNLACQLEELILAPLRKVRSRSDPSTWPSSIIIDGVDECEVDSKKRSKQSPGSPCSEKAHRGRSAGDSRTSASNEGVYEDIISTLLEATSDPAFPFRVVVVSRPEPSIRDAFAKAAPGVVHQLFLDEKYNADADIAYFLKANFAKLRVRFKLPKSWPAEPALAKLVRSASGQFVYVATVMRFIESRSEHPQALLDAILAWDGHQEGKCPLSQLDELYTKILKTSPEPALAVTWLHAILELHSENNDSLAMVRGFLETRPGETEWLLQSLASLVSFNDEGTAFRFFHKSLMDFLASPKRCGDLYVHPEAVAKFLQQRWYTILKNRGPLVPMEYAERRFFFRYYIEAFSMRYVYLPGVGTNYTRDDVVWWSDICYDILGKDQHQQQVKNLCEIVHEPCPWFLCDSDCRMWKSNLRIPTFHQMLKRSAEAGEAK